MKYKICPKCKTKKTLSEFAICSTRKDGHDSWCKDCRNKAERDRNLADPTRASRKSKASYQRRKLKIKLQEDLIRGILNWLKTDKGCEVTGSKDDLVFHHLNPIEKEFELSSAATMAIQRIMDELDKCVVVDRSLHGKIHSIMDGDQVTEFPEQLVAFMMKHHGWTHDETSWHPILIVIKDGNKKKLSA